MGTNGRASDGTVWQICGLQKALMAVDNPLNLPKPQPLPGRPTTKPIPYVLAGDDTFSLTTYMMKPYPLSGKPV